MVINDFDILCARCGPTKANAILLVYANAVLTFPAALECFEAIARRDAKVVETSGDLELTQLSPRYRLDASEPPNSLAVGQGFRVGAAERQNHWRHSNVVR